MLQLHAINIDYSDISAVPLSIVGHDANDPSISFDSTLKRILEPELRGSEYEIYSQSTDRDNRSEYDPAYSDEYGVTSHVHQAQRNQARTNSEVAPDPTDRSTEYRESEYGFDKTAGNVDTAASSVAADTPGKTQNQNGASKATPEAASVATPVTTSETTSVTETKEKVRKETSDADTSTKESINRSSRSRR